MGTNQGGGGKGRGGGSGAQQKRKNSTNDSNAKKLKSPTSQTCINLFVSSTSACSFTLDTFSLTPSPVLYGGARGDSFTVKMPERQPSGFGKLADQRLTSTFLGRDCHSCPSVGGQHGISDKKVFVLGDQFLPWKLGEGLQCVPTLRVEDADFESIKQALLAQKSHDFDPQEGSIYIVGLLSYICRVGSKKFWEDFVSFQGWIRDVFKGRVWPVIPPFPDKFPPACVAAIHNVIVGMQGRHMGNFVDEKDLDFCLWSPLDKFFHQLGLKKVPFTTEPFHLRGYKGGPQKIIFGPSEGWRGVSDSFSVHVPEKIESQFWEGVLLEVEKFAPISLAVELPDKSALQAGFVRSAIMPPPQIAAAGVPTIHLMGHSMAAEVVADLKPLGGGVSFRCCTPPLTKPLGR